MKQTRIIFPLDTSADEALSALSEMTGLGKEALAKRILSSVLTAIAGAMEDTDSLESREALQAGSSLDEELEYPGRLAVPKFHIQEESLDDWDDYDEVGFDGDDGGAPIYYGDN